MGTRFIFLHSSIRLTSILFISAALLAIANQPSPAAGEQDMRNQDSATIIRGVVLDEGTRPQPGLLVHCSNLEDHPAEQNPAINGDASEKSASNTDGTFELPISGVTTDKIQCWIDGGDMYGKIKKIVPVGGRVTYITFMLNFQRIPLLEGWITNPAGEGLHRARVQVTQSNGSIWSRSTDENGGFSFDLPSSWASQGSVQR